MALNLAGTQHHPGARPPMAAASSLGISSQEWRDGLPVLSGADVTLRELRRSDAVALATLLTTEQVTRFISPPPTTVEGFERFIAWTHAQQAAGEYICFAVVPDGSDTAVGIVQLRRMTTDFSTAEWGFAINERFWGTGLFVQVANAALAFAFEAVGVRRLEARAAVVNGRGNGALKKLGATIESVLSSAFLCDGQLIDQYLWTLRECDWRRATSSYSNYL